MKLLYKIILIILGVLAFLTLVLPFFFPNSTSTLDTGDSLAVIASLIAVTVALAAADPEEKKVNATVEVTNISSKSQGSKELDKGVFVTYSYRIHFKIKNISEFTLDNPTITFRLPLNRRHFHNNQLTFNSNMFNSQDDVKTLQTTKHQIISNSNLAYLNDKDEIPLWIRMVLTDVLEEPFEPFTIQVSINSENAQGLTEEITLIPADLIKQYEKNEGKNKPQTP